MFSKRKRTYIQSIIGIYKRKNLFRPIVEKKYRNGKIANDDLDYQDFDKVILRQYVDFNHTNLSC